MCHKPPPTFLPQSDRGDVGGISGSILNSSRVPQRSNTYAKATSSPAATSSETISNEAPCSWNLKNGGHVSR